MQGSSCSLNAAVSLQLATLNVEPRDASRFSRQWQDAVEIGLNQVSR